MNTGSFTKWTGADEEGTFSHIGKIVSQNETWIDIQTPVGLMHVRRQDGTFEEHAPITLKESVQAPKTVTKHHKGNTKIGRALVIYQGMKNASRQQLMAAFVEQLGMSPAGASTYAAQVKKM